MNFIFPLPSDILFLAYYGTAVGISVPSLARLARRERGRIPFPGELFIGLLLFVAVYTGFPLVFSLGRELPAVLDTLSRASLSGLPVFAGAFAFFNSLKIAVRAGLQEGKGPSHKITRKLIRATPGFGAAIVSYLTLFVSWASINMEGGSRLGVFASILFLVSAGIRFLTYHRLRREADSPFHHRIGRWYILATPMVLVPSIIAFYTTDPILPALAQAFFLPVLLYCLAETVEDRGCLLFQRRKEIKQERILTETLRSPGNGRFHLNGLIQESYSPSFFALYTYSPDHDDTGPLLDQGLLRSPEPIQGPPLILPEAMLSLFQESSGPYPEGVLAIDLLRTYRREDSEPLRLVKRFAANGAQLFLPLHEPLPPDETGIPGSELLGLVVIGRMAKGKAPLDRTDLDVIKREGILFAHALKSEKIWKLRQKRKEPEEKGPPGKLMEMRGRSELNRATFVFTEGGPMTGIMKQAERFAGSKSPVLITGETGTGKEQMARIIHLLSNREGPFVTLNSSAIPADLIENELFGHVRGAYTGADDDSEGLVARAAGGALFMDEIGELSLEGQVKLLRLVQEGQYEKIGSSDTLTTDARFIFATGKDLEEEVRRGRFRTDLYYRISTFEILLPPLRDRKEDILPLADHFLDIARETFHRPLIRITDEARELLIDYHWPGNIRELENLILRAVVMNDSDTIDTQHLPGVFLEEADFHRKKIQLEKINLEQARLEEELVREALKRSDGNQTRAARILNLSRGALQYRIRRYGIHSD